MFPLRTLKLFSALFRVHIQPVPFCPHYLLCIRVIYKYPHLLQEVINPLRAGTTSFSILYALLAVLWYNAYKHSEFANNNDKPFLISLLQTYSDGILPLVLTAL